MVTGWAIEKEDSWLSKIYLLTHGQPEDVRNPQGWGAYLDQGQNLEEEIRRSEVHLLAVLEARDIPSEVWTYALVLRGVSRHGTGRDCFQRLGFARYISSSPSPITESWDIRTD